LSKAQSYRVLSFSDLHRRPIRLIKTVSARNRPYNVQPQTFDQGDIAYEPTWPCFLVCPQVMLV